MIRKPSLENNHPRHCGSSRHGAAGAYTLSDKGSSQRFWGRWALGLEAEGRSELGVGSVPVETELGETMAKRCLRRRLFGGVSERSNVLEAGAVH